MSLQELRTFLMPLPTKLSLLFLMVVFTSYYVAIDGISTSMAPTTSTVYTTGIFQSTKEYQTEISIGDRSPKQDAALQNTSYMSPDNVFKLRDSPETNRVLNTGNQSEINQLFPTATFDVQKRDISFNRFEQSIDTTPSDIFKQYTSSKPKTDIKDLVPLDLCQQYSSCERVSNLTFKFCRCDALCSLYNDCCFNADITDNSTVSSDLQFDCLPNPMFSFETTYSGNQVVTSCPKHLKNTEIDMKCQSDDIFSVGPWVITDSNITFKNRFCAECNNAKVFKAFEVKFSNENVTISKNTIPKKAVAVLQDLYENRAKNTLIVEFLPPVSTTLRECIIYSDQKNVSKNCLNYYNSPAVVVLKTGIKVFVRNTFCTGPRTFVACIGMFDEFEIWANKNYDTFPMTVLFQFQQGCKSEFSVDGICLGRLFERKIRLMASIMSPTKLSSSMIEEILTIIAWSFSDDIFATSFNYRYQYNEEKKDYVLHIKILGDLINKQSYEEGLNIEKQLRKAQWLIRFSPRNGIDFQVKVLGVTLEQSVDTYISGATVQNKLNQFKVNFNDSFGKKLCANSKIECEISSDVENPRTVITEFSCVDFIEQQPIVANTNIEMNVITYTGMGISIIALTASILVYRRLGMHRSIPGSNVENLTIALIISDLIFMLGIGANDLKLVCYCIGAALHYLWLVVFSFKCIALIHMCHSLTKLSLISGDIEVGMFSKRPFFTLLGFLLPCLFVVPAVLIDFLEVDGVSINYSGSICFPTGYPGNLIFVSAPIGLAVVINITCLVSIAVVITKQSLGIRHIRRSNSFQYFPVFVRVSLVTGMLWISGLLGAIFQNEAIEYLFVIFCSFQGLLIAFGNLTTKRIYRELRKRKQSSSK